MTNVFTLSFAKSDASGKRLSTPVFHQFTVKYRRCSFYDKSSMSHYKAPGTMILCKNAENNFMRFCAKTSATALAFRAGMCYDG
jgi:hypothetical protein